MKKNLKLITMIYIGVAVFTYVLTLRIERLEAQEDYQKQNESIVLRMK